MVYIRLARVTAERKRFSTAGAGGGGGSHNHCWEDSRHVAKGKLWALLQEGHTLATVRLIAKDYTVCVA